MIFAAAVTTVTATAQGMKANVPFDFKLSGKTLPAGKYSVAPMPGIGNPYVVRVLNAETKEAAVAVSHVALDRNVSPSVNEGVLIFKCHTGGCALAQVHTPGSVARAFMTPPAKGGERERTVAVRISANESASGF